MEGFTTFDIDFTLYDEYTEPVKAKVRINLDEFDMEPFEFYIVFTDCPTSGDLEEVTVTQSWDTPAIYQSDVLVKDNVILTITSDIAFVKEASLFIEQGGTVIIDGGQLTSLCNENYWQGIDVWGDKTKTQFHSSGSGSFQGKIKVINGGKIRFAKKAIETIKYDTNSNAISTTSGGIVYINSGIIENCTQGVVFYPYKNFYPTANYPQPNWSVFYKASFFNDIKSTSAQIYFDEVDGIRIEGSSFENKYPVTSNPQFAWSGIYSENSGFIITDFDLPYPSDESIKTTFTGFNYGVLALFTNPLLMQYININSSLFEDNGRGIYLSAVNNPRIVQNDFLVRNDASIFDDLDEPPEMIGLYLDNLTTGFTVEENTFFSGVPYANLNDRECGGITVNNSGEMYNELYNNVFDNLTVGIAAAGTNRADISDDGLCIVCNDFTNTITDVYIITADEPAGNKQGIAKLQGDDAPWPPAGEPYDPTYAAGNTFSEKTDLTKANYSNNDTCFPIIYTHHIQGDIKIIPDPTVPPQQTDHIKLKPDLNVNYGSKETACPSNFNGGGIDLLAQKNLIETESQAVLAYLDTLDLNIDGGNTTSLNLDVTTSTPNESIELRQQLLDESPYLSDTVMNSAIYKENVLPNAMLRDVLVANPQSAKSPIVLQTIDERTVSMPEYMMDEILQGATIEGGKDVLTGKLSKHKANRDKAMKKLLNHYIYDTSDMAASRDSIINLLQNSQYPFPRYQLAALYLYNNDSSNAFNALNNIEVDFELTEDEENAYELFVDLTEIQWELMSDTIVADSIQIDELFDIADNLNTTAGIYARNMLVLMGEMEYYEPVYFPEIFKAQPIFGYNRDRNKQKTSFLKIFPNPANDYFTAETKIDKDFKEAYLVLVTINGKEMKRVELRKKRNQLIIPTNNISIGTYVLKLVVNDGIIESKKVIIIK